MTGSQPHHDLHHDHEMTESEAKRYEAMFKQLDQNKDGRIDMHDLTIAITEHAPHIKAEHLRDHVEKVMDAMDDDDDGVLNFPEFVKYVEEHEKKLQLVFNSLDTDQDGKLTAREIQQSFAQLGVKVDDQEAATLVKRIDRDGSLQIDFNEFRNFFYLHHSSDLWDIVHYWRHTTFIDVGDNSLVPDDFTQEELQTGAWWRNLLSGAAAGTVSRTFTAPLDRIKVLLQVHGHSKNITMKSGFQHMLQEGGWRSLWRGNGVNILKIAPETALKFMAYEQAKKLIKGDTDREIQIHQRFMAGSMAGLASQTIIYPMEVIKTRLCLRKTGQYSGMLDCGKKILQREGVRSFYRGYVPNACGIIPYAGIDLAVYETLKIWYKRKYNDADPSIMVILACGASSSTCGQIASYPLALVRTKLQAKGAQGNAADGMVGMFKTIVQTEGLKGLYRGIIPNFMKVIPAVSISYVVYERVRNFLGIKS